MLKEPNPIPNLHELELKQFNAALADMHEHELARLLDLVETLADELKRMSLHNDESLVAAIAAQRLLKLWNDEVRRILKEKQKHDANLLE